MSIGTIPITQYPYTTVQPYIWLPSGSEIHRPNIEVEGGNHHIRRKNVNVDNGVPAQPGAAPRQIWSLEAVESPTKSQDRTVSLVSLRFNRDGHDTAYAGSKIWVKNYKASTEFVLVADGRDSPLSFLLESTNETIVIKAQPFAWDGKTLDLDKCETCTVLLDGVISAPPAPTISQQLTSITYGLQFQFNYLSGQVADIVDGYWIYRGATSDSALASRHKYVKHSPINTGAYTFQDNVGSGATWYYWVTAVNTQGLESTLVSAQTSAIGSGGAVTTTIYRPTAYTNSGYTSPANAYDANLSSSSFGNSSSGISTCVWKTIPAAAGAPTAVNLKICSETNPAGDGVGSCKLEYSINSGGAWTVIYNVTTDRALATDVVALAAAQDLTLVQVRGTSVTGTVDYSVHTVYEVWVEVTT